MTSLRERLLAEADGCTGEPCKLLREAAETLDRLQSLCAAAYQMAGAIDAPVAWLDALGDAANGEPLENWRVQGDLIDKLLPFNAALAQSLPASGEEWVLVPRVPTAAMVVAFADAEDGRRLRITNIKRGLAAAIAAAAAPQTETSP
jgi:hypothetical protein